MKFSAVVSQTLAWLQREGRVSYRALKLEFDLSDEVLDALKGELIEVKDCAVDKDGKMLVWAGEGINGETDKRINGENEGEKAKRGNGEKGVVSSQSPTPNTQHLAERRQLTVMFCDLVGSTALSAQLDPEDLRAVVQQYQQTCAEIIQRYDGHIAQYLGDGVLVYFGYPTAHEDDAQRAVRAGLEIVTALSPSADHGPDAVGGRRRRAPTDPPTLFLQVRIGIHTGLVVVGEMGSGAKREHLALGEAPNIAARIQGLADPNTVMISAATHRLVERQFESQPFGSHMLKGIDTSIAIYHVQSKRQSISPLAERNTLTPLVGREQEIGLLIDRWEQAKEGRGQVVLLSGEPGIGKSRLAYTLREHVTSEGSLLFEARCSPYHRHSAFYPLIDVLQRTLLLTRQDSDAEKIAKLERTLTLYEMPESVPLLTALLSLPTPPHYPSLTLTPQKQKERTLQMLVQLLVAQAERQATVSVWEDLHWADPSSLEFLSMLIEQIPTTNLLLVLTFRPEFTPPWKSRSHISQLVLNRLGKKQVETMIEKVTAGKDLPVEAIAQILSKTDGVPLFVEEITKSVVESAGGQGPEVRRRDGKLETELGIPSTLQEALLARLDRLSDARQVAQLGATLGREFPHELLQAVTPLSETDLHTALAKLVEAEILYRRGVGEQARYSFKHALIQDTAYQSLLKSTRQQYHHQLAHVLEKRFPQTKETQPELLAHHYTEAGLIEQAIPYWQQAGQKAASRSANAEAIGHLTKGIELLKSLPDTPERTQQELILQRALGAPLIATKGYTSEEVQNTYGRVRRLCERLEDTPQLFSSLWGLALYYTNTGDNHTGLELSQQCLHIAEQEQDLTQFLLAHTMLGAVIHWFGRFAESQSHLERAMELYDSRQHRSLASLYGIDPGVASLGYSSLNLWLLGYPEQARTKTYKTLALAQELEHPFSRAFALSYISLIHLLRREHAFAYQVATELLALAHEQGFQHYAGFGMLFQGFGLVDSERKEERLRLILEGRRILRTLGTAGGRSVGLSLLLEVYVERNDIEEGLTLTDAWFAAAATNSDHQAEAELYRLKGELTLQKLSVISSQLSETNPQLPALDPQGGAEACFLTAINIAQKQQAKSLELRAVMSLVRLRQQQAAQDATRVKLDEAHKLLSEVYNWFTEGFDTKDLQEAKALLAELERKL
jgi:predicted ATPase/class 3 adenylate cyclase